jgi:hypothetical protein
MSEFVFHQKVARLRDVVKTIKDSEQYIKHIKADVEEEIAPYKARVNELKAEERALRATLTQDMQAGGVKAFGGVTLVEDRVGELVLPDEGTREYIDLALQLIQDGYAIDGQLLVDLKINTTRVKKYLRKAGTIDGIGNQPSASIRLESE